MFPDVNHLANEIDKIVQQILIHKKTSPAKGLEYSDIAIIFLIETKFIHRYSISGDLYEVSLSRELYQLIFSCLTSLNCKDSFEVVLRSSCEMASQAIASTFQDFVLQRLLEKRMSTKELLTLCLENIHL